MSSPPASLENQKATLRATALAARDALSGEHRAAAAQAIALRGLPFQTTPGTLVAGYSPIRSEIDPTPLMRKLAAQGVQPPLPASTAGDQPLKLHPWAPTPRQRQNARHYPPQCLLHALHPNNTRLN